MGHYSSEPIQLDSDREDDFPQAKKGSASKASKKQDDKDEEDEEDLGESDSDDDEDDDEDDDDDGSSMADDPPPPLSQDEDEDEEEEEPQGKRKRNPKGHEPPSKRSRSLPGDVIEISSSEEEEEDMPVRRRHSVSPASSSSQPFHPDPLRYLAKGISSKDEPAAAAAPPFPLDTDGVVFLSDLFALGLKEYQKIGARFIWDRIVEHSGGCILADEMGLGKTATSLAFIEAFIAHGIGSKVLVLVPKVVASNWEQEIVRWLPHRTFEVVTLLTGRALAVRLPFLFSSLFLPKH